MLRDAIVESEDVMRAGDIVKLVRGQIVEADAAE